MGGDPFNLGEGANLGPKIDWGDLPSIYPDIDFTQPELRVEGGILKAHLTWPEGLDWGEVANLGPGIRFPKWDWGVMPSLYPDIDFGDVDLGRDADLGEDIDFGDGPDLGDEIDFGEDPDLRRPVVIEREQLYTCYRRTPPPRMGTNAQVVEWMGWQGFTCCEDPAAPDSCPCTSWPGDDEPSFPCGGLEYEYVIKNGSYVKINQWDSGTTCSGEPDSWFKVEFLCDSVVTATDSWGGYTECVWSGYTMIRRTSSSGTDESSEREVTIYLNNNKWKLQTLTVLYELTKNTGITPSGTYDTGKSCYFRSGKYETIMGLCTVTEAT